MLKFLLAKELHLLSSEGIGDPLIRSPEQGHTFFPMRARTGFQHEGIRYQAPFWFSRKLFYISQYSYIF